MLGAIIGDIVGSRFEWNNHKSKDFELFTEKCHPTDDSIMTLAIANAILNSKDDLSQLPKESIIQMQKFGRKYPDVGYGPKFNEWLYSDDPNPYNSWGNGSAMRVSACGFAASSIDEAKDLSRLVTSVTHNHPEGLKGAEATAVAIYLAKTGRTIPEIYSYIDENYYKIDFRLDDIRDSYEFHVSCQNSVPQAFETFFESKNFEDAIRNAISIGGDSDTIAAIAGSIAEAYYGIPDNIRLQAISYMDSDLLEIINESENTYSQI